VVLGLVAEKVAGESLKFLDRRILQPLAMTHTVYDPVERGERLAQGYTSFALGPAEIANPEGRGWVVAAGALWSTPSDLAQWDLALMDGKILRPDSFKLMTAPRTLADGTPTEYGCGLTISRRRGVTVLTHNGMVSGFNAHNSMIPSTRSAVVILSNSEFLIGPLHARILSLLTQPKEGLPQIAGMSAADAAKDFFARLQNAKIDRQQLGEEFDHLLTADRLRAAAIKLKPFGQPTRIEIENLAERGGMEVANLRFSFDSSKPIKALMYRTPDGKIQEFLVIPD
jgi:CubicO group peptidase (beta-lactamase class C family)